MKKRETLKEMVQRIIKEETRKKLTENNLLDDFLTTMRDSGVKIYHDPTGEKIVISGTSLRNVVKTLSKFDIDAWTEKKGNNIIIDYSRRAQNSPDNYPGTMGDEFSAPR